MSNQNWIQSGDKFSQISKSAIINQELPIGIYTLNQNEMTGEFFLTKQSDKFEFSFKVYGTEERFISHVMTTFNNTTTNLGVLLNGVKGTGKTVCAKMIANQMNLPCIIISREFNNLNDYLASFDFDCILFFDEFEKNFEKNNKNLLSIMDGVYNTTNRKIFLLTTNTTYIDSNYISRPSRIRYKKTFGNLPLDVIFEYLNDNLIDKSKTKEIVEFINTLSISTIDILKCIVDAINLHKCSIDDIKDIINIETAAHQYKAVIGCNMINKESFKAQYYSNMEKIKNGETDSDGDKYCDIEDFGNFYTEIISSDKSIAFLEEGDFIGSYVIDEPIDSEGFMVIKRVNRTGETVYHAKILNTEDKPKLYGHKLEAYAYCL